MLKLTDTLNNATEAGHELDNADNDDVDDDADDGVDDDSGLHLVGLRQHGCQTIPGILCSLDRLSWHDLRILMMNRICRKEIG